MTDEQVRGQLAIVAGYTFFGVAGLIVIPAGLGFTDFDVMKEVLVVWSASAGPLTGGVFGYFFGSRSKDVLPP